MYNIYMYICYGLNMKCPLQPHVLGVWLPADGFLGSDRVLRPLT
jgi:hypothetical protein